MNRRTLLKMMGVVPAIPAIGNASITEYPSDSVLLDIEPRVGLHDDIYRPESVVFHADTLSSFANKPIVNEHPYEPISATNFKKEAIALIGDEIYRVEDSLHFPVRPLSDEFFDKLNNKEYKLYMGSVMDIETSEKYEAVVTRIRLTHIAFARDWGDYNDGS